MPTCINGHYLPGGTAFCGACGDDVRPRCEQGHPGTVGARFCARCGAPVTGPGLPGATRPGTANGMPATAEDVTPLLMMQPTADPPPPSTVTQQVPWHYGPSHPEGIPDLPPATIQMPGPNGHPPGHGGRHRGGQPPARLGTFGRPFTSRADPGQYLGVPGGRVWRHRGGDHADAPPRTTSGRGPVGPAGNPFSGADHTASHRQRPGSHPHSVIGRGGPSRMDLSQAGRSAGLQEQQRRYQLCLLRDRGAMLRGRQRR